MFIGAATTIVQAQSFGGLSSRDIICYEPEGSILTSSKYIPTLDLGVKECLLCKCINKIVKCEFTCDKIPINSSKSTSKISKPPATSTTLSQSTLSVLPSSNLQPSSTSSPKTVSKFTLSPHKVFEPISIQPDEIATPGPGETTPDTSYQDDLDSVTESDESEDYGDSTESRPDPDIDQSSWDRSLYGPKSSTLSTTSTTTSTTTTTPATIVTPQPTGRPKLMLPTRTPARIPLKSYFDEVDNGLEERPRYKISGIHRSFLPVEAVMSDERPILEKNYVELGLLCVGLIALLIAITTIVKTICAALVHICAKVPASERCQTHSSGFSLNLG